MLGQAALRSAEDDVDASALHNAEREANAEMDEFTCEPAPGTEAAAGAGEDGEEGDEEAEGAEGKVSHQFQG